MKWLIFLVFTLSGCFRESATLEQTNIDNKTVTQVDESTTKIKPVQSHHTSTSSSFQPRKFSKGETYYINYCSDCHGWEGRGNSQAEKYLDVPPPILLQHNLLAKKSENDFVNWVLSGTKMQIQLNKKASLQTDPEIKALLAYIKKLPGIDWDKVHAGQKVYDQLCVNCHGIYGRRDESLISETMGSMPDLGSSDYQTQHSDEELIEIISKGKEAMPGTENALSTKEIKAVVTFIRLFSPGYESYDRFCVACHGLNGSPEQIITFDEDGDEEQIIGFLDMDLPTFDAAYLNAHTDKQLIPKIQHMLKSERVTMPHFSDYIGEKKIREIFKYLKSLIAEYP